MLSLFFHLINVNLFFIVIIIIIILFILSGVLYRGGTVIKGVPEVLNKLERQVSKIMKIILTEKIIMSKRIK